MNRFQLYKLVEPVLPLLHLSTERTSLCHTLLYEHFGRDCFNCQFYTVNAKGHCHLWLANTSAQQLKADIILKHPELLI